MQDFLEFGISLLSKAHAAGSLWLTPSEGKTEFGNFSHWLLEQYRTALNVEKSGLQKLLDSLNSEISFVKTNLEKSSLFSNDSLAREVLKNDVLANKAVLENLIGEERKYLERIKNMLAVVKELKVGEPSTGVMADLLKISEHVFGGYVNIGAETLRRYEAQKNALIKTDAMTPPEVMMRIEGKTELLRKDLANLEKQVAFCNSEISMIDNKVKEIDNVASVV